MFLFETKQLLFQGLFVIPLNFLLRTSYLLELFTNVCYKTVMVKGSLTLLARRLSSLLFFHIKKG